MGEYFLDDHQIFNAGDHFGNAAAFTARFNIDIEDALEALYLRHGHLPDPTSEHTMHSVFAEQQ